MPRRKALPKETDPGSHRATGRRPAGTIAAGAASALVLVAVAAFVLSAGVKGGTDEEAGNGERTTAPPVSSPTASGEPARSAGAECGGEDCTGRDPEAMGCGGPHVRTVAEAVVGEARVEVRYSEACGAAWARVSGAGPGDTLRITTAEASQHGEVGASGRARTLMVAAATPGAASACVTTPAGAQGCTAGPR